MLAGFNKLNTSGRITMVIIELDGDIRPCAALRLHNRKHGDAHFLTVSGICTPCVLYSDRTPGLLLDRTVLCVAGRFE